MSQLGFTKTSRSLLFLWEIVCGRYQVLSMLILSRFKLPWWERETPQDRPDYHPCKSWRQRLFEGVHSKSLDVYTQMLNVRHSTSIYLYFAL